MFLDVCEFIMILGSLSANGWGCVPVFLAVWCRVSSTVACGRWVELGLSIEMEISGWAFVIWYYVGPGGCWWSNVLNSALLPRRHRPDMRPEQQDPVSHIVCLSFRLLIHKMGIIPPPSFLAPSGHKLPSSHQEFSMPQIQINAALSKEVTQHVFFSSVKGLANVQTEASLSIYLPNWIRHGGNL